MTTEPNHRDHNRRPLPPTRRNPFQAAPAPIPAVGWNLRAADLFSPRSLAEHLDRNAAWLQARPRTSNAIEDALFPEYALNGMEAEEVRALLNAALWDAGYAPNATDTRNPTWTWTEGE